MLFFSFCLEVPSENSVPIIEEEKKKAPHTYHPQIQIFLSSSLVTFPFFE